MLKLFKFLHFKSKKFMEFKLQKDLYIKVSIYDYIEMNKFQKVIYKFKILNIFKTMYKNLKKIKRVVLHFKMILM